MVSEKTNCDIPLALFSRSCRLKSDLLCSPWVAATKRNFCLKFWWLETSVLERRASSKDTFISSSPSTIEPRYPFRSQVEFVRLLIHCPLKVDRLCKSRVDLHGIWACSIKSELQDQLFSLNVSLKLFILAVILIGSVAMIVKITPFT